MDTGTFTATYRTMISLAAERLREDRYAVLVVASARVRRRGLLRDLRGLTVEAAQTAGLGLLNEAVLLTMIGFLPHRSARMFTATAYSAAPTKTYSSSSKATANAPPTPPVRST